MKRRDFLKIMGAALAAATLPPAPAGAAAPVTSTAPLAAGPPVINVVSGASNTLYANWPLTKCRTSVGNVYAHLRPPMYRHKPSRLLCYDQAYEVYPGPAGGQVLKPVRA